MDTWMIWAAALLALAYGLLTALAGLGQLKQHKIQAWAAWGMLLCGLIIAAGGALMWIAPGSWLLYLLGIGLVGIHLITINNGLRMFGKIKPGHHLVRLLISITILALAYLGLG